MNEGRSSIILKELLSGKSMQDIAEEMGISRQRVHQLLTLADRTTWQIYKQQRKAKRYAQLEHAKSRRWKNKPKDRFWENVDIRDENECWEWKLSQSPGKYNYGCLFWGNYCIAYAHRVAWELTHGPIPTGMFICHHCDNPPCCNPSHLFLGTPKDNSQDAVAKGRWKGPRSKSRKLTIEQAQEVMALFLNGESQCSIARKYPVSYSTVHRIIHGQCYCDAFDK